MRYGATSSTCYPHSGGGATTWRAGSATRRTPSAALRRHHLPFWYTNIILFFARHFHEIRLTIRHFHLSPPVFLHFSFSVGFSVLSSYEYFMANFPPAPRFFFLSSFFIIYYIFFFFFRMFSSFLPSSRDIFHTLNRYTWRFFAWTRFLFLWWLLSFDFPLFSFMTRIFHRGFLFQIRFSFSLHIISLIFVSYTEYIYFFSSIIEIYQFLRWLHLFQYVLYTVFVI